MNRLFKMQLLTLCGLALSMIILSGCSQVIPTPTWSNDSQSFLYTQRDGSVSQYDLSSKSARVLVGANNSKPCRVAISPDNELIAVAAARATNVKDLPAAERGRAVQIAIIRLADGEVQTSKSAHWGNPDASLESLMTAAYWSSTGQKILIRYDGPNVVGPEFAVYDVPSETLAELDSLPPETLMTSLLGVSPLVPDGSGYLAVDSQGGDNPPKFVFVDWEGHQEPLEDTANATAFLKKLDEERKAKEKSSDDSPFGLANAKWEGNVLVITTSKGCLRLDAKQRTASFDPLSEKQKALFEGIPAFCAGQRVASFPDTDLQVRLYHMKDEPGQKSSVVKLEIYDPKQKKRHQPHQEDSATIGPLSPDGKYLLVEAGQGRSDWIYVIRSDGTVVDKVGINEAR